LPGTSDVLDNRRIEEEEAIAAKRQADSEASLMGTVIDEERERQRRIEQDYPTYTEPLQKTKALEEIERRRRIHSHSERDRQQLAAAASARLFPRAVRPVTPASALWNSAGLIKRHEEGEKKPKRKPMEEKEPKPRYGQFITSTRTKSEPMAALQKSQFMQPYSSVLSELKIQTAERLEPKGMTEVTSMAEASHNIRVCKDTYRSKNRPRLVVRHQGLAGSKWYRATETVELDLD